MQASLALGLSPAQQRPSCQSVSGLLASCSYRVPSSRRAFAPAEQQCGGRGRRAHVIACSSGTDDQFGKAYDGLFQSKVFRSELVVQEFNSIVKEVMGLSGMSARFPDFDLAGKQMYLDKMEDVCGRYRIFIKRLELADDPGAKQYLTTVNAQMLNGGFTIQQMFTGFEQSLQEYRRWVEEEERVLADPVAHQEFLKRFRSMWGASALGKLDLSYLMKFTDPAVIMKAQSDPQFWVAIKEISTNPTTEVLAKWMDDPNIGPLVAELWKSMQKQM